MCKGEKTFKVGFQVFTSSSLTLLCSEHGSLMSDPDQTQFDLHSTVSSKIIRGERSIVFLNLLSKFPWAQGNFAPTKCKWHFKNQNYLIDVLYFRRMRGGN